MSHSWRLSRGSVPSDGPQLGSEAVDTPLTPPSVRNMTSSTCLSVVQFRALLREYRSLDDSVTTRLNRIMANSRAAGLSSSPSLLSRHVSSSSSTDLGKSTYATAPEQACATFWKELMNVWIGREEVLEYCLQVEERERKKRVSPSHSGEEWLLNNDVEKLERQAGLAAAPSTPARKAKYDAFDSRASRSEDSSDALRRHLNNELSIEAIIRKRSLDVFKSRCPFFTPLFASGKRGEQEQAMWEGVDTHAARQAQQVRKSLS